MVTYCFALDILFAVMNWYKPKTWLLISAFSSSAGKGFSTPCLTPFRARARCGSSC